ncbi:MFS general substrate transporter [Dissoconium aciculare CBS 342.82]|uniref:MFS general substrate transporter n=1 Tax=Dissoconium aciculare CBS 342.82 TaxID=1314786 RepID=A0A6J3MGZ0_9PEZI|nr:MFS general substrate transporter [Dissoconium aciculare CBS 342.82]KAF1827133.1 MFS general substrate transporter [Dissoconium aciculare CBS 342.82]
MALLPKVTASRLQVATYLLGIALFSISFLVFLNSTISFVVTSVVGRRERVGDAVGTLGFADEILAIIACPLWGLLSDRIGTRPVAVMGYSIIGVSLICLVQSTNVYPDMLLSRLGFSLGGAACSTMVTAILPAMVAQDSAQAANAERDTYETKSADTAQIAGIVGLFTGVGALLALAVFLPLPALFQSKGQSQAESVRTSYYIVAAIAFAVALFTFFGLRNLPGEAGKTWRGTFRTPYDETTSLDTEGNLHTTISPAPTYISLIKESVKLGFTDHDIGLGYLGGFVARASSVAISLFIPLFVNAYFVHNGLCTANPDNSKDIKENCERAYKLAAALSGIAETAALLCAPLFGVLAGRAAKGRSEWPLLFATLFGIVGYVSFGLLRNPDAFHGHGGEWALLSVTFVGISQIGAIVCSLGMLGRGIHRRSDADGAGLDSSLGTGAQSAPGDEVSNEGAEAAPLLSTESADSTNVSLDRSRLKGSIAGIYSLVGGVGILLLTKLGGALFDSWSVGAPFFLMAIFNGVLCLAILAVSGRGAVRTQLSRVRRTRRDD